jgi:uncharacterized protein YjbI with pentapeptide repeats
MLALAAVPAHAGAPRVRIEAVQLKRDQDSAQVTARVRWIPDAVARGLTAGDMRLVAVSARGHRPTLLAKRTVKLGRDTTQDIRPPLTVTDRDALAAMRRGNRIVLTASQHAPVGQGSRTVRTYVTVAEVQPFGPKQPRIGTDDCSAKPVVVGAVLNNCDLVGAFLDMAEISSHDGRGTLSTRLVRADLTGATMVRANLSGASIAGGRVNGADATGAELDNLSLAGTEAVGLIAVGAKSDAEGRDSGVDAFDANLSEADLRNTVFNGASFEEARLDRARLQGARWPNVVANAAGFRGANLAGLKVGPGATFLFADFTDATLRGKGGGGDADITDLQLAWAKLCRTILPRGSKLSKADADRDCRDGPESPLKPAPDPDQPDPYVTIRGASVTGGPGARTIKADVRWDDQSRSGGGRMVAGDLRVVAVDGTTGKPTLIAKRSIMPLPATTHVDVTVTGKTAQGRRRLAAMQPGNRIVLTATQHPPFARAGGFTDRSYVTVATLQRGRSRGRVGRYDCSRVALVPDSTRLSGLDFCDLTGATLNTAALGPTTMRDADLTGATIERGRLDGLNLDGAALAGVEATGATVVGGRMLAASAPGLTLSDASVTGTLMQARNLSDASFARTDLNDTVRFATATMLRATFDDATLDHTDLGFANLMGASLKRVRATESTLFLADLTHASLADSTWTDDEEGELPWLWATLCDTTMPPRSGGIGGNRDCPR